MKSLNDGDFILPAHFTTSMCDEVQDKPTPRREIHALPFHYSADDFPAPVRVFGKFISCPCLFWWQVPRMGNI